MRLGQPDQKHRLESISQNIPDVFDKNVHGTHRQCYQRFTNTYFMSRKRSHESTLDQQPSISKQTRRSASFISSGVTLFPSDKCLFCDIDEGQAIALAFELASSDEKFLKEAALITRRHIDSSKRLSSEMPWPPSPQWLLSPECKPPTILKEFFFFFSFVISGKSQLHNSLKISRLVDSLSQDICYAATHGEWVMPKHLLLSMTVRHLTGSAELITNLKVKNHKNRGA